MLSKVLKGSSARQAPAMAFAATTLSAKPRVPLPSGNASSPSGDATESESILLEKIRTLEARIAPEKKEAFDAGYQRGEKDAQAALAPVLERMNASIVRIMSMRPDLRRRAEKDAVELSLQIARRVLHRELSIDSNALNALARVVFDRLARSESWQLTVHPQFADAIRGSLPAKGADKVRIEIDPSCAPGTILVRSGEGVVDASVDSQLAEITRGLTDRLTLK